MFDLTDFCRICTRADCTLIDISTEDSDAVKYSYKLTFCIAEAIIEDDVLPNLICDTCCKNLQTSYSFKKICLRTRKLFSGIKDNDTEKPVDLAAKFVIKEEYTSDNELEENKKKCAQCGGKFDDFIQIGSKNICDNCKHECTMCSNIFSNLEDLQQHCNDYHNSQITPEKKSDIIKANDTENEKPVDLAAKFVIKEQYISDSELEENDIKICAECGGEFDDFIQIGSKKICDNCKHECTKCSNIFSNLEDLQQHCIDYHNSQITPEKHSDSQRSEYICAICDFHYPSERLLMVHMRIHSGEQPYQCNICKERFSWQHHLQRHKQKCRPGRAYPCKVCRNKFLNAAQLKMHMRQHVKRSKDEELRLKKMEEEYQRKKQIAEEWEELRTVDPLKRGKQLYFPCKICNKSFPERYRLIKHFCTHFDEKTYKCKICGKCFSQKVYLSNHERTHTERPRPFKCKVCFTPFLRKVTLDTHMKIHERTKKAKCYICRKKITYVYNLKKHLKHIHGMDFDDKGTANQ